jgi:hypothetical protein
MIENHPLTPTGEQLKKWEDDWFDERENVDVLLIQAFQAGADTELEACIDWISMYQGLEHPELLIELLRAARRPSPKPLTLKEQALIHFDSFAATFETSGGDSDLIRRALEQLPE